MVGQRRHEEAMREMLKRKQEQAQKKTGVNAAALNAQRKKAPVVAPTRGIAAGVKTKNKHLQEFEKIKAGHNKRKGVHVYFIVCFRYFISLSLSISISFFLLSFRRKPQHQGTNKARH